MMVFGHYISRSAMVLSLVEVLIFGSVFLIFGYLISGGARGAGVTAFATEVVLPTGLLVLSVVLVGGYQLDAWRSPRTMARRVIGGGIAGSALIVLIHDVLTVAGPASFGLALAVGCGCVLALFGRLVSHRSINRILRCFYPRILVLGSGRRAAMLWPVIERTPGLSDRFAGFLRYGSEVIENQPGDPSLPVSLVHGAHLPLAAYAVEAGVDEIIIALDAIDEVQLHAALLECRLHGIKVFDSVSFIERETGRIGLEMVNTRWLAYSPGFRRGRVRAVLKRQADIFFSLFLLTLTLPVLPLVALAVKLTSPGPILFRQVRVGLQGKHFTMFKFRSMRADAEADGRARWATTNDVRITPIGKILRTSRLDELPQLYNVLRGDMSLVGPRPERPDFVDGLAAQIPFYSERHSVRPGITGWAQTSYPYAATVEDTKTKLEYDLYYVKNYSLFLDIVVLFQTVRVALRGVGAR